MILYWTAVAIVVIIFIALCAVVPATQEEMMKGVIKPHYPGLKGSNRIKRISPDDRADLVDIGLISPRIWDDT